MIAGGLSAGAFPPLHLVIMLVPAFMVLFWMIDGAKTLRRAFLAGWLFGLGHFAVGFYWVGHSFLVDAAQYGWLAPIAVLGLAIGLALFPGLIGLLLQLFSRRCELSVTARILGFAILWIGFEWLRGWILTGFPWNQIGSVWAFSDIMMQFASLGGVLGLGFVTVFAATLPAGLGVDRGSETAGAGLASGLGFGSLGLIALFGFWRLFGVEVSLVDQVKLRLVQPNVPQHLKWKPDLRMGHVRKLISLSLQPSESGDRPSHIIWPETAVPFDLQNSKNLLQDLAKIVPPKGILLTGAPRSNGPGAAVPQYWNSLIALAPEGHIAAIYDKIHLVPFGEYVPWREVLKFSKLTAGRIDFSKGQRPRTVKLEGLPAFAPLICYEVIFADEVRSLGRRPAWLLNITNDAWFGLSTGPYQHLAVARFRALEMGVPLVRVANTGISALVDPYGRVRGQLGLGTEGFLDVALPQALGQTPLYGKFGDWFVLILMGVCALIVSVGRKRVPD